MIVFWFCVDLSFLDCEFSILIFTLHQPLLGRIKATRGLLLLAAEISHGTDAFPVLWLARAVTLAQLSDRAANQSDSDICSEPRGEPRRLRLSICVHCNLAAPRSRQENPRPLLAAYGRDRIALCVHFLESFFVACRSPRRHDSRVSAPVGRVGRVGPGRVVGVFSGAVWRRRWAPPSHKKIAATV